MPWLQSEDLQWAIGWSCNNCSQHGSKWREAMEATSHSHIILQECHQSLVRCCLAPIVPWGVEFHASVECDAGIVTTDCMGAQCIVSGHQWMFLTVCGTQLTRIPTMPVQVCQHGLSFIPERQECKFQICHFICLYSQLYPLISFHQNGFLSCQIWGLCAKASPTMVWWLVCIMITSSLGMVVSFSSGHLSQILVWVTMARQTRCLVGSML